MSATVSINHIPRCLLPHQADKDDKNCETKFWEGLQGCEWLTLLVLMAYYYKPSTKSSVTAQWRHTLWHSAPSNEPKQIDPGLFEPRCPARCEAFVLRSLVWIGRVNN